jgi:MFS family permease
MSDTHQPTNSGRSGSPLTLLGQKNFRRVWLVGAVAGTMRWLDMLAIGVYVLEVTNSPLTVAMTLFVRMLPMLLFGAVAGAYAERVDRKKFLVKFLLLLAGVYFILFLLAYTGNLELWQLSIGVFISGIFWALELTVRRTMIAEIGGMKNISAAMGLDTCTNNATRALGPFVGGFLYETFGLEGTLLLGTTLHIIAGFIMMQVVYVSEPIRGVRLSIVENIIDGVRFVKSSRAVMATLAITIVLNLFGFSFMSMVPVIAKNELGLSPFPTGVLMSAEGCGALVGALLIAFFANSRRFHQIYFFGASLYLCCVIAFSVSGYFTSSVLLLLVGGFGLSGFAAMQSALVLGNTPPEKRNRVMGVLATCIGFGPIGILIVGMMADQWGAANAVTLMSGIGITLMICVILFWPEMRKIHIL